MQPTHSEPLRRLARIVAPRLAQLLDRERLVVLAAPAMYEPLALAEAAMEKLYGLRGFLHVPVPGNGAAPTGVPLLLHGNGLRRDEFDAQIRATFPRHLPPHAVAVVEGDAAQWAEPPVAVLDHRVLTVTDDEMIQLYPALARRDAGMRRVREMNGGVASLVVGSDPDAFDRARRILDAARPAAELLLEAALEDPWLMLHVMTGTPQPETTAALMSGLGPEAMSPAEVVARRTSAFFVDVGGSSPMVPTGWPWQLAGCSSNATPCAGTRSGSAPSTPSTATSASRRWTRSASTPRCGRGMCSTRSSPSPCTCWLRCPSTAIGCSGCPGRRRRR